MNMFQVVSIVDSTSNRQKVSVLRTVPPNATAHTCYLSREGPRNSNFLRTVPINLKVFLPGL